MSSRKTTLSREVPFIGGKSLLYNWTPLNLIMDKYSLETFGEFDNQFLARNASTYSRSEIVGLLRIGLERRDQSGNVIYQYSDEEINNLLGMYMDDDHVAMDVVLLIIEAIYGALIHKKTPPGEAKGEMTPGMEIQEIPPEPSPK